LKGTIQTTKDFREEFDLLACDTFNTDQGEYISCPGRRGSELKKNAGVKVIKISCPDRLL
jgi:hypothetical protein